MNRPDERDNSVDRLLRRSLGSGPQGTTSQCLDAEALAAWAEGGLTGRAFERAQTHLATCNRCQAVLGTLIRTEAAVTPSREPAPRRWLAWLVPITAAAAAIALWIAVPRDDRQSVPPPQSAVADARGSAESAGGAQSAPSPAARADADRAERIDRPASPTGPAASTQPASTGAAGSSNFVTPVAERRADTAPPDQTPPAVGVAGAADVLPSPPAAPPAAARALESAARPGREPAPASSPAAATAKAAAPSPPPATLSAATARSLAATGIVITSPDPAVRWRIGESRVEYSTSGGAAWVTVLTGAGASLLAGAAPTPTVCWVVGRAGAVWLAADSRPFVRVAFPEATDLTGVRARDARTALVSTADGRVFGTSDGGATWTPRPLQDFRTAPF